MKNKKVAVTVSLPPELWKAVKREAVEQEKTLGAIVIQMLTEYLGPKAPAPQEEQGESEV